MNTTNPGRTVLITGAGGCIGSALAKAVADSNPRLVILLDHSEQNLYEVHTELAATCAAPHVPVLGDISDDALLNELCDKYRPDVIYHAAAFKHVPLMEANPIAVIRNNVLGTSTLAKAAVENRVPQLVMISTDKAVNPRSVMGASKRVAELVLLRFSNSRTRMSALRLGNVLGSPGSVVPLFQQQIRRGGPMTVTHRDSCRYFLSLRETVEFILEVAALRADGAIFVPALGEPVKIVDLAKRMIQEAGPAAAQTELVFTGLRPGDKLSEELLSARERPEPVVDSRLRKVTSETLSSNALDSGLRAISEGVRSRHLAILFDALCQLVPEYQPSETLLGVLNPSPV